ncbi:hypothetical protein FNF28_04086 [Cafeteria roenbergensis]|uniref:Uncharacterized protein n=1 Tax=Cafeteria roenbergensis TaxID=33653 RepID=A0A5A8DEU7_CAFRO|nr:hypothetical protein FNF28_04086 [Cafeteria roenbergensis]
MVKTPSSTAHKRGKRMRVATRNIRFAGGRPAARQLVALEAREAADKPELLSAMHKRMVEIEERCAMLERRQVAAQSSMKQGTRLLQSRVEGLQRRVDTSSSAVAAAGGVLRVPGQPAREPSRGTEPAGAPWTGSQDRVVAFIPTSALREAARAAPSMEDSRRARHGKPPQDQPQSR